MDNNEIEITPEITAMQKTTQTLQLIAAATSAAIGVYGLGRLAYDGITELKENRRAKKTEQND